MRLQVHIVGIQFQVIRIQVRSQTKFETGPWQQKFYVNYPSIFKLIWLNTIKYEYNMSMIWYQYVTIKYMPKMVEYNRITIHDGLKIYLVIIEQP